MESDKILEIKDLTIAFGKRRVVDGVNLSLGNGKITALVGESGSGKTITALSILDLLPAAAERTKGEILFKGKNIFDLRSEELRSTRGKDIGIVFQEPFTALNPVIRIGEQIRETIEAHERYPDNEISGRINELLHTVKLTQDVVLQYPHELSGGMRQRVMLAIALSCDPDLLILDEPTTALDVSVQKHILDLIKRIQGERHLAVFFITHDFSVVNMIADEVSVMKEGILVESGPKDMVLKTPQHEYTKKLIGCIPRLGDKRERLPA